MLTVIALNRFLSIFFKRNYRKYFVLNVINLILSVLVDKNAIGMFLLFRKKIKITLVTLFLYIFFLNYLNNMA